MESASKRRRVGISAPVALVITALILASCAGNAPGAGSTTTGFTAPPPSNSSVQSPTGETTAPADTETASSSDAGDGQWATSNSGPYPSVPVRDDSLDGYHAVDSVPADLVAPGAVDWAEVLVTVASSWLSVQAPCGAVSGFGGLREGRLDFEVYTRSIPTAPMTDHLGQTVEITDVSDPTIEELCGPVEGGGLAALAGFLASGPSVDASGDSLTLTSADGRVVALRTRVSDPAPGLTDRRWLLTSYRYAGQEPVAVPENLAGWLEFSGNRFTGTTGCNYLSPGLALADPQRLLGVFVGWTEKFCGESSTLTEPAVTALFHDAGLSNAGIAYTVANGTLVLSTDTIELTYSDVGPAQTTF